ncbi:MAG: UDP-N-acetylmuramoyl-tripeptide--D-alanyl-D-alanine ligase [Bifidobacteriaceae bacterium]|nr:UDP-N-acetylmuramoyl-tripeptide--D-alanyl-D-alanine ligase [Bifidobacteriaceae bacterium]
MMTANIAEIAKAIHAQMNRDESFDITPHVVSDSRQITQGDIFVAINGENVDGHDYVQTAYEAGAVAAIVEHEIPSCDIVQLIVTNSVRALGDLARFNIQKRRQLQDDFTIIGITGSVGKTTTKDLLFGILSRIAPTVAPVGSFNNEIGLPLTCLQVNEQTRYLVAEMGANHVGEIAYLTTIAPPDISIVLKVGVAHLGEFGSVEQIAQAKSEIVRGLVSNGVAVLNKADEHVKVMSVLAPHTFWFDPVVRNSSNAEEEHDSNCLYATNLQMDALAHPRFTLVYGEKQLPVSLQISGEHNVANAMAAIAAVIQCGINVETAVRNIALVQSISPHRMAISTVLFDDGVKFTLIDDSFNANPDSMKAGIRGLLEWHEAKKHQDNQNFTAVCTIAVLGAMLELGENSLLLHRQIGEFCAQQGVQYLIAVGSKTDEMLNASAQAIAQGAQGEGTNISIECVQGIAQVKQLVHDIAKNNTESVVLLKGSHASGLSELAQDWQ